MQKNIQSVPRANKKLLFSIKTEENYESAQSGSVDPEPEPPLPELPQMPVLLKTESS